MGIFRIKTPFCGTGDLRSVSITAGFVYLIFALGGASTGFGYKAIDFGYGSYGTNYMLMLLGISSVVWIISNILLIYGAIQMQHTFVLPWIYWQLAFIIIALMVLIWSSFVMAELSSSKGKLSILLDPSYGVMRNAMIAALCCVVPFLFTVIYCFIVVYSFYCDLKGAKSTEDMPDTSVSPAHVYVKPTVSSTSQRTIPVVRKREEHIHDVRSQTACHNSYLTSSSNITSDIPPALPARKGNIFTDVQMRPVRNNLLSNAPKSEEDEVYVVYEDMPDTSVSPAHVYVKPTVSSTSQRTIPVVREREEHIHDVRSQTACHNSYLTSSSNITSDTPPALPARKGNIYTDVQMRPVRNNLLSNATKSEEDEVYAVYEDVLPPKFPQPIHFI